MPRSRPARPVDALRFDTFATPCGPCTVAVDAEGALVSAVFGTEIVLAAKNQDMALARDPVATREARRQLEEYFAGRRRRFTLKLAARGTWFQRRVWDELTRIPFGATTSYGDLATEVGRPGAARAVGRANATNPICVIVPCHRVIRSDGALTGFAYGTEIKRLLLELEGALPPALL